MMSMQIKFPQLIWNGKGGMAVQNGKIKNPLIIRIPRELAGDWKKYFVVCLFLILTIGLVSGMYVANGSMEASAENGRIKYKREDGHFVLEKAADAELISAVETGEKADIRQYYVDQARTELDERFDEEFAEKFQAEFETEFADNFETAFQEQIRQSLTAQGLDEASAGKMLPEVFQQAKESGDYQSAYDEAYPEACAEAYDEAYPAAYDEAWADILEEIEEKYADAEEKYELNDPGFAAVPVTVYENFFRNEAEDKDSDGIVDGTVRVYIRNEDVNLACLMDGRFPDADHEIAIDRMHADNVGVEAGDTITVGGESYDVVGLVSYVNYYTLHENSTDFMFDALKFDVAMVTEEGFARLGSSIHYCYAWNYLTDPAGEKEEKRWSDDFLKALLTQTVTADRELADYIPAYANPAIHFATDDMGSDKAMGGVLLDILVVIIAFIFAVTISNTIVKEASVIGTLRASGYSRSELVAHYLSMPVIVTVFSAAAGNVLGYTVFKKVVVSMYYNSYSLPVYETVWNFEAFFKTTLIPVALMLAVNLAVLVKMMSHTPLQFLRHDLKKTRRKKAVQLPRWKFLSRFRLRVILQNIPNYAILFVGILFIATMLSMAVGMPDTLKFYKDNAKDMMFSQYQYVLKSYEDDDGNAITTENADAEKFSVTSLLRKGESLDEEVSVYGLSAGSRYVTTDGLDDLGEQEVYISLSFAEKYGLSVGSSVLLDEKYENRSFRFDVAGIYDRCQSIAVFMPIQNYRIIFDAAEEAFSGYLSDTEITDIDEAQVAAVITEQDLTKMCDQLDHSMGNYMKYFQVLCILLSAVLIYLLTKIIIEKNENPISMVKILGYENREIAGLYLFSTTIVVVILDAASTFFGALVMTQAWKAVMAGYSGWFPFRIAPAGYAKIFVFVLIGYLLVMVFDFRRIRCIPMDEALKNVE